MEHTEYLNRFPELVVRWTKEKAALITGKPKEKSWIWQGRLKGTTIGHTLFVKGAGKKDDAAKVYLYIERHNALGYAPTVNEISTVFFRGDLVKTLAVATVLVTACAVQFIEEVQR